jgi:hypothetical protein
LTNTDENEFIINGEKIEVVNEHKYLGKIVSFEDSSEKELNLRIAAAWRSFWSLKKFLLANIPLYYKRKLMDTCILPVLTYGSQCWSFNARQREKTAVAQRNMEKNARHQKNRPHKKHRNQKNFQNSRRKPCFQATQMELGWSHYTILERKMV